MNANTIYGGETMKKEDIKNTVTYKIYLRDFLITAVIMLLYLALVITIRVVNANVNIGLGPDHFILIFLLTFDIYHGMKLREIVIRAESYECYVGHVVDSSTIAGIRPYYNLIVVFTDSKGDEHRMKAQGNLPYSMMSSFLNKDIEILYSEKYAEILIYRKVNKKNMIAKESMEE